MLVVISTFAQWPGFGGSVGSFGCWPFAPLRVSKGRVGQPEQLTLIFIFAEEDVLDATSQNNSCVAMIVKGSVTASASRSSDGSEQEPLHLAAAGRSPSQQVCHFVVKPILCKSLVPVG